jgi:hypothetical protein
MQIRPFSEIREYFRLKLNDPAVCLSSDQEYSFLKILQHALSYAMIGDKNKLIRNYLHLPYSAHAAILYAKSIMRPSGRFGNSFKRNVIIDPGRTIRDAGGVVHSVYFEKLRKCLEETGCTTILKKKTAGLDADILLDHFMHQYPAPDLQERKMLRRVHDIVALTINSGKFSATELEYIKSCLHIFFDDFRFYYHIFKGSGAERVYFICHYHSEGLIAALNILGIKSIELQHGLISGNDLYYAYDSVFRPSLKNAFFPDKILVYGDYWKRILLRGSEFREDQIQVAGDYLYRNASAASRPAEKENLILICAQKGMHEDYVNYCLMLKKNLSLHSGWRAIVKLHPLESKKEAYEILKEHGFDIAPPDTSLDDLLAKSKIQISIYSTTFFDAIGFDVLNLSVQHYGTSADYAADIIREGVAAPIRHDEDPVAVYLNTKPDNVKSLTRSEIYASFRCEVILNA